MRIDVAHIPMEALDVVSNPRPDIPETIPEREPAELLGLL
jgi:hypothetical protein